MSRKHDKVSYQKQIQSAVELLFTGVSVPILWDPFGEAISIGHTAPATKAQHTFLSQPANSWVWSAVTFSQFPGDHLSTLSGTERRKNTEQQ